MLISNYANQNIGDLNLTTESPILAGCYFTLELADIKTLKTISPNNVIIENIHGITDDIPAVKYNTTLKNSPVAKVTDFVKKFTEHDLIKKFSETNPGYRPAVVTDGWSQQQPDTAEPFSVELSFRTYPDDRYMATNYENVIKFLLFVTTPKKYNLSSTMDAIYLPAAKKTMQLAKNAARHISDLLKKINNNEFKGSNIKISAAIDAVNRSNDGSIDLSYMNAETKEFTQNLKIFIDTLNDLGKMDEFSGGCPLVIFRMDKYFKNIRDIPFIIKNWSFKPAVNVMYNKDKNKYYPIYIDFKISLETQHILTNKEFLAYNEKDTSLFNKVYYGE